MRDLPCSGSAVIMTAWHIHLNGGCVITRGHMLQRIRLAHAAGIPITNYGVAISLTQGVLERALGPFPEALAAFRAALEEERPSRK